MRRKKTRLICQNPDCGDEYDALRDDSKYCCPACRTAGYRIRSKAQEKFRSLYTYYPRESYRIREIREQYISHLKTVLDLERQHQVPFSSVQSLYEKLRATTQRWTIIKTKVLQEQVEWIWTYVEGFLCVLISGSGKTNIQRCNVHLPSEVREGIEKLIR